MNFAPQPVSILDQDPRGRMDVALVRLTELFVRRTMEPALGDRPLWDRGLGAVVEQAVADAGIPSTPFTAVDICRALGILKKPAKRGRR
jgi:hypothetical protein